MIILKLLHLSDFLRRNKILNVGNSNNEINNDVNWFDKKGLIIVNELNELDTYIPPNIVEDIKYFISS